MQVNVRGTPDNPVADGVAHVHRAVLAAPWLPRPMTGFGATVRLNSNVLSVESLEGHTGRKGRLSVHGALSLAPQRADTWAALVAKAKTTDGIQVKVENLEVRVCGVVRFAESVMSACREAVERPHRVVLGRERGSSSTVACHAVAQSVA